MPCEMKRKEIDGRTFTTMQLDAVKALEMEARLAPIVTAALPVLIGDRDDGQTLGQALGPMFDALWKVCPPAEWAALLIELCELAAVDGQLVDLDRDFNGPEHHITRYKLAAFVLEANFGHFLRALLPAGLAEAARAKAEAQLRPMGA